MNEAHLRLCSSPEWARYVEDELIPWALEGRELGDSVVEVGSGMSTLFLHRAIRDGGLATRLTSIDPAPREPIDRLCDEIVRRPLEDLDPARFAALQAGDVLFLDGSHRVFENSDVVAFYLDILPTLAPGVLVGIHDVLWPEDYLPEWGRYWFSEQYLLGAYLLAEPAWLEPVLAAAFALEDPELAGLLEPLWALPATRDAGRHGFGFWLRIGARHNPGPWPSTASATS